MNSNRKAPPTGERQSRFFAVERSAIDEQARTVELAFSSEQAVERSFGPEVLDHSETAMRLGRLRDGGPVLVEHDASDHVGVIEEVAIGPDRKARAKVRFGRSTRAQEVLQDVIDGIKRSISVGYMVHKWEVDEMSETWRAVDWEPYEISFVSIPADPTVGVGRSADFTPDTEKEEIVMDKIETAPAAPAVDVRAIENEVRSRELKRIADLEAMGKAYGHLGAADLAREMIAQGKGVDDMRVALLERAKAPTPPSAEIGLTKREAQEFSIARLVNAEVLRREGKTNEAKALGGFELEASDAARAAYGSKRGSVTIPFDVMLSKRDVTTSVASGTSKGGNIIATDLMANSFIDVLRNAMVLPRLGATFMPGLVGNVAIPKLVTGNASYWVAENAAPTEGAPVMGQVTMSPKTVAAYVDISRRMVLQSTPAVEALMRQDLTQSLAVAIDEAGIGGTGSNKPTGVRGTSGIGSVAIGTNGGAPTWASIVNLVREVDVDNALTGSAAFLTNSSVKAKLATTLKTAGDTASNFLLAPPYDSLYGYPLVVSNQVPSNLTKGTSSGVCSAMLFGVWSDLLIGQWSGIDLLVDPYSGSSAGTVRITAFADVDVAVRRAESFAAVLDLTTT